MFSISSESPGSSTFTVIPCFLNSLLNDKFLSLENIFLINVIIDTLNIIITPDKIKAIDTILVPVIANSFSNNNEKTAPIIPPPLASILPLNARISWSKVSFNVDATFRLFATT